MGAGGGTADTGGGTSGTGGGTSGTGGGTSGTGGGTSGTGGGAGRTVRLTYDVTSVDEQGHTVTRSPLLDGGVQLFSVGDGGMGLEPLSTMVVGRELVATGVPPGDVVLRMKRSWVVSGSDTIDLSWVDVGRADALQPDAGEIALTMTVSGIDASTLLADSLELYSPGSNLYGFPSTSGLSDGGTSFMVDYATLSGGAVDATRGDSVWAVAQNGQRLVQAPALDGGFLEWWCDVSTAVAHATGFTATSPSATLPLSFVTAPTSQVSVRIRHSETTTIFAQLGVDAAVYFNQYTMGPVPLTNASTGYSDLLYASNYGLVDVDASVVVVDPFPPAWQRRLDYSVWARNPVRTFPDGGRHYGTGFISVSRLAGEVVQPSKFGPMNVTVQGQRSLDLTTLDAAEPLTVAWQPPTFGPAPTTYRVDVRLIVVGGQSASTSFATVDTPRTSFTFPAGVLLAGRAYFLRVEARYAAVDSERQPWGAVRQLPYDATATFTPAYDVR